MKTTHRTKALAMSGLLMAAGSTMQATPRQTPGKTETKNAPAKPAPEKEKKEATIEFDNWEDADSAGTGAGTNFRYQEDDLVVTGDKARYKRNKKGKLERFEATGNLVMDDEKHHITGGKADVDHTKRLAIITENVVIVLKPKPEEEKKAEVKTAGAPDKKSDENGDASSERKRGVTITCDRVEDQYKKKFTTMRGHLVFKQKIQRNGKIVERTMTAEHAEYDGKTEQMELFKPVRAEDSDGQHIEFTDNVTLGTKEGEETLKSKGKVIIKTPVNEDEDEENGEATPKPADGKKATQ